VVEFDGAVKYAGADGRAALVAEKLREDRLRALGYEVVRIVWSDLARPDIIAGELVPPQGRWCQGYSCYQCPFRGTSRNDSGRGHG